LFFVFILPLLEVFSTTGFFVSPILLPRPRSVQDRATQARGQFPDFSLGTQFWPWASVGPTTALSYFSLVLLLLPGQQFPVPVSMWSSQCGSLFLILLQSSVLSYVCRERSVYLLFLLFLMQSVLFLSHRIQGLSFPSFFLCFHCGFSISPTKSSMKCP
jgi:hypothetical protein